MTENYFSKRTQKYALALSRTRFRQKKRTHRSSKKNLAGDFNPEQRTERADEPSQGTVRPPHRPGHTPRVWVDLEIDQVINLADISFVVMAFEGRQYTDLDLPLIGTHPAECP